MNFADRGTHLMAEADKVILAAFYGAAPAHAYFSGCSQGGHEALIEAQRYPADYDGIIAGDPANYWTHHYVGGHLWPGLRYRRRCVHSSEQSAHHCGRRQ